jgi:TPR repeat protein
VGGGKEPERGHKITDNACTSGSQIACRNLAVDYRDGNAVEKDVAKAISLFQSGCDHDFAASCTQLAFAYRDGAGVAKDSAKAFTLLQKACDGADPQGCGALGDAYDVGDGVAPSREQSLVAYKKGCDAGWTAACRMYSERTASHRTSTPSSKPAVDDTQAKFQCELDHERGWCGGHCVSINTSQNCGRCGKTCTSYQKCIDKDCADTGNAD